MRIPIENLTDQLEMFTLEVVGCIETVEKRGFTREQAIEIVRIGVENIKAETSHHRNKRLAEIGEAVEHLACAIDDLEFD